MRGGDDSQFRALLNGGPKTMDELPRSGFSPRQRKDGVAKFNPTVSSRSDGTKQTGKTTAVFYIVDEHEPETVIQKWIDVNKEKVEKAGKPGIHQRIGRYGKEWKQASREVLDPGSPNPKPGQNEQSGGTCPMCGDEYPRSLARHLPCDE